MTILNTIEPETSPGFFICRNVKYLKTELSLLGLFMFEMKIKNEQIFSRLTIVICIVDFLMVFAICYNIDIGVSSDTISNQLKWVLLNCYLPIILIFLIPVILNKLLVNKFLLYNKYEDKDGLQIIKLFIEFSYLSAIFFSSVFYYTLVVVPNAH